MEKEKISALKIFIDQFKNFLIIILLAATVISAFIGEWLDAIVIFVIVIACAILGLYQEYKAEKAVEALKRIAALTARVIPGWRGDRGSGKGCRARRHRRPKDGR